jgi:hypothetical protein
MTSAEQSAYKHFVRDMTDDELDAETSTVIRQDSPDKAILIQFIYTEWLNRGNGERFTKAYNKGVS